MSFPKRQAIIKPQRIFFTIGTKSNYNLMRLELYKNSNCKLS